jgi:hypothetical protein
MSGCAERNPMFCFPCLLSAGDTTWAKTGVMDLKHLDEQVKKNVKILQST